MILKLAARRTPDAAATRRPLQRAVIALPAHETWVPVARRFVSRLLAGWHLSTDEQDNATLIVAELAANAARHGRSDMAIAVTLETDLLHITVADHGTPGSPVSPDSAVDPDEHGRGLHIVHTPATRVETLQDGIGRCVRATLLIA